MAKRRIIKLTLITSLLLASVLVIIINFPACLFHAAYFFSKPYDKDFYQKNYQVDGDKIYLLDQKNGKRYPIKRYLRENFENTSGIQDLISFERGWNSFTLQSPKTPTINDYNKLQEQILTGKSSFSDNRVEPSSEHAHSGKQALKTVAAAPSSDMTCTKASLATMFLHFVKGDDVWFSGWYYFDKIGQLNTLMDLESTFVRGRPGMRICLNHGYLSFQLAKWSSNPMYRQNKKPGILFPDKRWVHIKTRLRLTDGNDGIIQLWQDGKLIIDQRGQTLPFADAVYNNLEIGLSAHSTGPDAAVLYVDDVVISANPIEDPHGRVIPVNSNISLE